MIIALQTVEVNKKQLRIAPQNPKTPSFWKSLKD
jgi:hypothetical protein